MKHKISESFQCRICEANHDSMEGAALCCIPFTTVFECECGDEFYFLDEATGHVHDKTLQDGKPTLGEWATAIQVEGGL